MILHLKLIKDIALVLSIKLVILHLKLINYIALVLSIKLVILHLKLIKDIALVVTKTFVTFIDGFILVDFLAEAGLQIVLPIALIGAAIFICALSEAFGHVPFKHALIYAAIG